MSTLPCGWATSRLLEVCDLLRGVTYTKSDASSSAFAGSIPVLRAGNIVGRDLRLDDLVYVPDRLVSISQRIRRGDVVIATSSGSIDVVGKAAQAHEDMEAAFGAFCGLLRPHPGIEPRFFGYFFASGEYRAKVSGMARGVNINNLKRAHFASLDFPVPPVAEQKRIADKLDSVLARVDACGERLSRVSAMLKRFRQSVLAAAMAGELTKAWRNEPTAPVRPTSWNEFALADLCLGDRVITYGVIKLGDEIPDGVPCLRTSNVRWLRVDLDGIKRIDPKLSAEYGRTVLRGGEVLVNVRGTLGGVAVADQSMRGWNVSREVAVVPVDATRVLPKYLAYWVAADHSQRWLAGVEKGVAYTGINIEDLRTLPVSVPPLDEQREVVRTVEELLQFADRIELQLRVAADRASSAPRAILAKAFRGELIPQDPNDEPAAVMLDRIRTQRPATSERKRPRRGRSMSTAAGRPKETPARKRRAS